jgi:hypothetical protein
LTPRQLPAVDYASLKTATRALIKVIGTETDAAGVTRVAQPQLSKYVSTSPDNAEFFVPIDIIADLEAECGQPVVTRKLAELSGHELVPLPEILRDGNGLDQVSGAAVKAAGEFLAVLGSALADGKLGETEMAAVSSEGREVIAVIWRLIRMAEISDGGQAR